MAGKVFRFVYVHVESVWQQHEVVENLTAVSIQALALCRPRFQVLEGGPSPDISALRRFPLSRCLEPLGSN